MRDNHEGYPELITAYERDDHYFGVVGLTIDGETRKLEFGVTKKSYYALKRILTTRPFDKMPGLKYRYFLVDSVMLGPTYKIAVRIELEKRGIQYYFEAPIDLIQNLLWFIRLKSFKDAHLLREIQI